ncbi:MAG: hypothetical protein JXP34_03050 [Planctomycetes bacterium]|nr:hypothetical protein [Planctomycetota bacterium]
MTMARIATILVLMEGPPRSASDPQAPTGAHEPPSPAQRVHRRPHQRLHATGSAAKGQRRSGAARCGSAARRGTLPLDEPGRTLGKARKEADLGNFGIQDWAILVAFLGLVLGLGLWVGRRGKRGLGDFFLGGRRIPPFAIVLSILAAETSVATFVGVPAFAYRGDWSYILWPVGFIAARFFVAFYFIGAFYRRNVFTVYGWLETRFGPGTQRATAAVYILARILASGVRVFIAAIAFAVVCRIRVGPAIAILSIIVLIYTLFGGIRAVIWNDVLQGVTFIASILFVIGFLILTIPGGWAAIREAMTPEKTAILRSGEGPISDAYHPLAALVGAFFLTLASHGTDQDIVQRCLSCRDDKGARMSMVLSGLVCLPVVALFLIVGFLLYVFYAKAGGAPAEVERVFPIFIRDHLPHGINAIVMAGIFSVGMSSHASVLAALSSTAVTDIYEPIVLGPRAGKEDDPARERHLFIASRAGTIIAALLLAAVAVIAAGEEEKGLVDLALQSMTLVYGAILGVFLVGLFVRGRGNGLTNGIGMAASMGTTLFLRQVYPSLGWGPPISWAWYTVIGTAVCAGISVLGRTPRRAPSAPAPPPGPDVGPVL